jgi:hypothetical protein
MERGVSERVPQRVRIFPKIAPSVDGCGTGWVPSNAIPGGFKKCVTLQVENLRPITLGYPHMANKHNPSSLCVQVNLSETSKKTLKRRVLPYRDFQTGLLVSFSGQNSLLLSGG